MQNFTGSSTLIAKTSSFQPIEIHVNQNGILILPDGRRFKIKVHTLDETQEVKLSLEQTLKIAESVKHILVNCKNLKENDLLKTRITQQSVNLINRNAEINLFKHLELYRHIQLIIGNQTLPQEDEEEDSFLILQNSRILPERGMKTHESPHLSEVELELEEIVPSHLNLKGLLKLVKHQLKTIKQQSVKLPLSSMRIIPTFDESLSEAMKLYESIKEDIKEELSMGQKDEDFMYELKERFLFANKFYELLQP